MDEMDWYKGNVFVGMFCNNCKKPPYFIETKNKNKKNGNI